MVQSVERTLALLEFMKKPQRSFSLAQLSEAVQLPPSTVHRILQTLCFYSYAVKDEHTHLYSLGPALISLGASATANLDLTNVAAPILKKLSEKCREDSFLIILSGYHGLVLCHEEGPRTLKIVENPDLEVELHCGAIRKALLAHQDKAFLEGYMDYCRNSFCTHPIADTQALFDELRRIRQDGVSLTNGDYISDGTGIGAPVFDAQGRVRISLGIVMPTARARRLNQENLKMRVKDAAAELSSCLGYQVLGR